MGADCNFVDAGHSNSVYPEEILQIVANHLGGGGGGQGVGLQSKSIILSCDSLKLGNLTCAVSV